MRQPQPRSKPLPEEAVRMHVVLDQSLNALLLAVRGAMERRLGRTVSLAEVIREGIRAQAEKENVEATTTAS